MQTESMKILLNVEKESCLWIFLSLRTGQENFVQGKRIGIFTETANSIFVRSRRIYAPEAHKYAVIRIEERAINCATANC